MCRFVHACLCLCVRECMCLCVCVRECMCVCVCECECAEDYVCVSVSVSASVQRTMCLCLWVWVLSVWTRVRVRVDPCFFGKVKLNLWCLSHTSVYLSISRCSVCQNFVAIYISEQMLAKVLFTMCEQWFQTCVTQTCRLLVYMKYFFGEMKIVWLCYH